MPQGGIQSAMLLEARRVGPNKPIPGSHSGVAIKVDRFPPSALSRGGNVLEPCALAV